MRVKAWSTPRVTIHRCPEICHLGMQFVHNWFRKRPYALCKSCRGMLDLQLSYSNFCALEFKFLDKNTGQSRKDELVLTLGAPDRCPRRHSRVGRAPAPLGPHDEAEFGPLVCAPWDPLAPHRLPPPLLGHHASRAPWSCRTDLAPPAHSRRRRTAPRRRRTRAHAATWPTRWRARTALQATTAYKRQETHTSREPRQTRRRYH
jgi:hypothetical protein